MISGFGIGAGTWISSIGIIGGGSGGGASGCCAGCGNACAPRSSGIAFSATIGVGGVIVGDDAPASITALRAVS